MYAQNKNSKPTSGLLAVQGAGFGRTYTLLQKDEKRIILHGDGFRRTKRVFWGS